MNNRIKFGTLYAVLAAVALYWAFGCTGSGRTKDDRVKDIILAWNNLYLELDRVSEGYYAPVSARNFAYISLTAYEAAQPVLRNAASVNKSFHGLRLPEYDTNLEYDLAHLLNSAYAESFRRFFQTAPQNYFSKINELEDNLARKQHTASESDIIIMNSRKYGLMTANDVYLWSATDSYGHEVNKHLYDNNLTLIGRRNSWLLRTEKDTSDLLPYWGKVRPFLIDINTIKVAAPELYSESPSSEMYKEALALYTMSRPLGEENRWIAEFWSDDLQGITFSPSARWVSIANQVTSAESISPEKLLECYLELGFSLCDASIVVWKAKYQYNQERPQHYINRLINKNWRPIYENPNFPSYPSGHAAFAGAASVVLTEYFGENYKFTDRSHEGRREFNGKPRSYNSFREMAIECAYSRTAAGFHSRSDAEQGLKIGFKVASELSHIPLSSGSYPVR